MKVLRIIIIIIIMQLYFQATAHRYQNNIQVQQGKIYTIDSHFSYTYKHRYHCPQIEDVSMFVDDMKHSKIELSVQLRLCINLYKYFRRISSNDVAVCKHSTGAASRM